MQGREDRAKSVAATALRIVRRLLRGSTVASRSLPIRAAREEVQRAWSSERERILDGLPVTRAELSKGADQGEWGTSWTLEVEFEQSLPRRLAQPLAGKAVRRLKSQAETGEVPTTAHNPAFRGARRQEESR